MGPRWDHDPACETMQGRASPSASLPRSAPPLALSRPEAEPERPRRAARAGSVFGRRSGEVAVFEAVAVAFEGEDLGVVDEPVDHRGGGDFVAEDLAPSRRTACWR